AAAEAGGSRQPARPRLLLGQPRGLLDTAHGAAVHDPGPRHGGSRTHGPPVGRRRAGRGHRCAVRAAEGTARGVRVGALSGFTKGAYDRPGLARNDERTGALPHNAYAVIVAILADARRKRSLG